MKLPMLAMLSLVALNLIVSAAHASVWISCGSGRELDGALFEREEAQFSSENDRFSGEVGGTWNLKLGNARDWLEKNKNITAKTTEKNDITTVEVTITTGRALGGATGTRYVLTDIYSDEPKLEKFNLAAGFAGNAKIGTFKCLSGND